MTKPSPHIRNVARTAHWVTGIKQLRLERRASELHAAGQFTGDRDADARLLVADLSGPWPEADALVRLELWSEDEPREEWVLPARAAVPIAADWVLRTAFSATYADPALPRSLPNLCVPVDGHVAWEPTAGVQGAWRVNLDPHRLESLVPIATSIEAAAWQSAIRVGQGFLAALKPRAEAGEVLYFQDDPLDDYMARHDTEDLSFTELGKLDLDPTSVISRQDLLSGRFRVGAFVTAEFDGDHINDRAEDPMDAARTVAGHIRTALRDPSSGADSVTCGPPVSGRIGFGWSVGAALPTFEYDREEALDV